MKQSKTVLCDKCGQDMEKHKVPFRLNADLQRVDDPVCPPVAGKRSDGGIHTWMVCKFCGAYVRSSRHSPEDCDTIYALKHDDAHFKAHGSDWLKCDTCCDREMKSHAWDQQSAEAVAALPEDD